MSSVEQNNPWRKCSTCKKPILHNQNYYFCPIGTCKKSVYCSLECFDSHTPVFNHKNPWAEERKSPKFELNQKAHETTEDEKNMEHENNSEEVLVVASKLKNYIKNKSGMNTSANVMPRLSDLIREITDKAIENAKRDGRKTVMDRDF